MIVDKSFSRWKAAVTADEPSTPESVEPCDDEYTIDVPLGAAVAGSMDRHEPEKKY